MPLRIISCRPKDLNNFFKSLKKLVEIYRGKSLDERSVKLLLEDEWFSNQALEDLFKAKSHFDQEILDQLIVNFRNRLLKKIEDEPYFLCNPFSSNGSRDKKKGKDGVVRHLNSWAEVITSGPPDVSRYVSEWALEQLKATNNAISDAALAQDHVKVIKQFLRVRALINYPTHSEHSEDRFRITEALRVAMENNVQALWPHSLTVQQKGSLPRPLSAFLEAHDFKTRLAPTEALVRTRQFKGRDVLGMIDFNPARPGEIRVSFDVEFSVDPWLASLANLKLVQFNETYGGAFTNWSSDPGKLPSWGSRKVRSTRQPMAVPFRFR